MVYPRMAKFIRETRTLDDYSLEDANIKTTDLLRLTYIRYHEHVFTIPEGESEIEFTDINHVNHVVGNYRFVGNTQDATAKFITSVKFNGTTGKVIITVNAEATADVDISVKFMALESL